MSLLVLFNQTGLPSVIFPAVFIDNVYHPELHVKSVYLQTGTMSHGSRLELTDVSETRTAKAIGGRQE